jgi:hypothetical protein
MSIVRIRRQTSFTVIPNEVINDKTLDGSALGLLVYLLSKPDDWNVSIRSIESLDRFGSHDKIMRTLKAIRESGYAHLQRKANGTTDWTITDTKGHFLPNPQNEDEVNAGDQVISTHPYFKDEGLIEPHPQNPNTAFKDVLINKDLYKELKDIPTPPTPHVMTLQEKFEIFWKVWPRKVSRGQAEKTFNKLNPSDELLQEILSGIDRARQEDSRFEDRKFTPHASTWLNAKGWMDEHEKAPTAGQQISGLTSTQRGNYERPKTASQTKQSIVGLLVGVSGLGGRTPAHGIGISEATGYLRGSVDMAVDQRGGHADCIDGVVLGVEGHQ